MLGVERRRNNTIAVTYKDRTSLFTKDFIFSLSIAIAFHISFLLLFHIKEIGSLFNFPSQDLTFQVESDPVLHQILAEADSSQHFRGWVDMPAYEGITAMAMPNLVIENHLDNALLHLDHQVLFSKDLSFTEKEPVSKDIEIYVSHQLAGREITYLPDLPIRERGYAIYDVQIDENSGKIVWAKLKSFSGKPKLELQAKQFLDQMVFQKKENGFIGLGEVRIVFNA